VKFTSLLIAHEGIVKQLGDRVRDPGFVSRHRRSATDFVRDCILTFQNVLLIHVNLMKSSLQTELDNYFKVLSNADFVERVVTKSAFSAARNKLKPSAFVELNSYLMQLIGRAFTPKRWHGLNLRAVDGSTLRLLDTPDVIEVFGREYPEDGRPFTLARISHLFDPLNCLIHDAIIAPYHDDERSLLLQHLKSMHPGDLLLLDAGYPAFWLFAALAARKIDWCARASLKSWSVISAFVASGHTQAIVTLTAHADARRECQDRGLSVAAIHVRLVRVVLPDGTVEVLMTSLLDIEEYPHEEFQGLYHMRWAQEESYKFIKCRVEIANWTGKSTLSVYQDFHARILATNLAMTLVMTAQDVVDANHTNDSHPKQVNKTQALSALKDALVRLLTAVSPIALIRSLVDLFARTVEIVRPNRSYERRKDIKPTPHYTQIS